MATQVYRCTRCRREVLVRVHRPLTPAEIARRREEELRPPAPGRSGTLSHSERMRDDIWQSIIDRGVATGGTHIPREHVPERCPACAHHVLEPDRIIE